MAKHYFIDQMQDGDRFDEAFLVKSARIAETRTGRPYLILTVVDKSGEISGPVWDNAEAFAERCQVGSFIRLCGQVQSYREKLQIKVESVASLAESDIDPADFVAATAHDLSAMADAVQALIRSVENSFIRRLLQRIFKAGEVWDAFRTAPAAKGIHHAYVGGLLEHCLSMAKLADFLAAHYPGVDRSLLLAGVLLHDIGKVKELQSGMGLIEYTDEGRLKGHLVIGSELVAAEARALKDFPDGLLVELQHLILSHHGRQEFGSPTVPMTVEALLLSQIDDMDAKMNLIERLRSKIPGGDLSWTEYQKPLERYLYLRGLPELASEALPADPPRLSRQQSLF